VTDLKPSLVFVCLAFVLLAIAAVSAQQPAQSPARTSTEPLQILPADSICAVQIRNFEYTIHTVDRFLTGVSPVPLGLSMLVRMKLAEVLGNPELAGVDTNGTFGLFVQPLAQPSAPTDPTKNLFVAAIVPVTDYQQFITANPNCSRPDSQGISKISAEKMPGLIVKQVGDFALVTSEAYYDSLIRIADAMASGRISPLAAAADGPIAQLPEQPVFVYVNVQAASQILGPAVASQLALAQQMMATMPTAKGRQAPPALPKVDFNDLASNNQIQSVTLSLEPKPTALGLSLAVAAIPGTKAASILSRSSPALQKSLESLDAKPPAQVQPNKMASILTLLPEAKQADFVGSLNLIKLFQLGAAFTPVSLPKPKIQPPAAKSPGAYALKLGDGRIVLDVVLPKQHLVEFVAFTRSFEQEAAKSSAASIQTKAFPPNTAGEMQFPAPTETISQPGPVESSFGQGLATAPAAGPPAGAVQVAAVRLVRYADYQRGILPLGQTTGYTLALVAQLPSAAVKVIGGAVEKATSDTGKSLLSDRIWERRIKLPQLAKDKQTAIFEIDLLVPDEQARGIDELTGTLEYLTASGSRSFDLGVIDLTTGARVDQFGACVSLVEQDPYGNNATVVALSFDLPAEQIKTVQLLSETGSVLPNVTQLETISFGASTTVKFAIAEPLPAKARIALERFENLQRKQLPFRITNVSLLGQPNR